MLYLVSTLSISVCVYRRTGLDVPIPFVDNRYGLNQLCLSCIETPHGRDIFNLQSGITTAIPPIPYQVVHFIDVYPACMNCTILHHREELDFSVAIIPAIIDKELFTRLEDYGGQWKLSIEKIQKDIRRYLIEKKQLVEYTITVNNESIDINPDITHPELNDKIDEFLRGYYNVVFNDSILSRSIGNIISNYQRSR